MLSNCFPGGSYLRWTVSSPSFSTFACCLGSCRFTGCLPACGWGPGTLHLGWRVAVGGGHVGWRCWPGLFAWGPPSQGLWGTQRREWEPLNQHCAGRSDRRRPAGGGHMSGELGVPVCLPLCTHAYKRQLSSGSALGENCRRFGGLCLLSPGGGIWWWQWPWQSTTQSLGRSQAICTLSVSACCLEGRVSPGGRVSGWLLGAAAWAFRCCHPRPGVPPCCHVLISVLAPSALGGFTLAPAPHHAQGLGRPPARGVGCIKGRLGSLRWQLLSLCEC